MTAGHQHNPAASLVDALAAIDGVSGARRQAPLAELTTWRVGGPADLLCVAETVDGLIGAAKLAASSSLPWLVLGRGSNVLIRDDGIEGLVIVNRSAHLAIEGQTARADSGLLLSTFARRTAAVGLAGVEWAAGIPGSVGGAVVSNAGAHGGCVADSLRAARLLNAHGASHWVDASDLGLAYRHSRLRDAGHAPDIVLQAEFELRHDEPAAIRARMDDDKRHRKATQPLASASAGSVFKNPPGDSAARLIDAAGLKGTRVGGASVSTLHANFIITERGARADDLLALAALVRSQVRARFSVELDLEVLPIGRQAPAIA
jgi:UDP-N-acetylmuramate dehydrogenase